MVRNFIVLCLVAVACADKLGYNYQPLGHSDSGLSFSPGAGIVGTGDYDHSPNVAPSYTPQGNFATSTDGAISYAPQGDFAASTDGAPSYASQGDFAATTNDAPSFAPQAELEKEFFTFTTNDEDFNDPAASSQLANSVKQGLRVVFIKGPDNNGLGNAALALAKHASEQKTDIYVLNKQADLDSLASKLNTDYKNNNNKPEVHFVKYRTPEDAVNAQNAIQGQYESLGGRSQSYNGGVVPVLNFASKAAPAYSHNSASTAPASADSASSYNNDASAPAPVSSYIPPTPVVEATEPSSSYLPASILRLFRL